MHHFLNAETQVVHYTLIKEPCMREHFHKNIEIQYVLSGSVSYRIDDQQYSLGEDDIVIINANQKHGYESEEKVLLACFHINQDDFFDTLDIVDGVFWCNSAVDGKKDYRQIKFLLKAILNNYVNPTGRNAFYELGLYYKLMEELADSFFISGIAGSKSGITDPEQRIQWILHYINQNYHHPLSLQDIADKLYLTIPYLSRMIKQRLGMNYSEYLTEVRLTHAVNDLIYSDEMITAVAMNNGFTNASAFNKLFRERMNMTPSDFRSNHRQKVSEQESGSLSNQEVRAELSRYFLNHPFQSDEKRVKRHEMEVSVSHARLYEKSWNQMLNIGYAIDLLKYDTQKHILHLQKKLNIIYIRFWGIFSDSMYVDGPGQSGRYNFDKVTQVLDFLVESGLKPFIELGDKPRVVHKGMNEDLVYQPNRRHELELVEFQAMFLAFLRHAVNKYGVDEVEEWYFEFWRDDDIGDTKAKTHRPRSTYKTEEEYFKWFAVVQYIVKRLVPGARVGGGGFNTKFSRFKLTSTFRHFKALEWLPDFWSAAVFPYDDIRESDSKTVRMLFSRDEDYMRHQLEQVKESIEAEDFAAVPFFITEWNSSISNRDVMHDDCFKAAYIVKNALDSIGYVKLLGYWIGSDLFSEYYDSTLLLNGSAGLLSKNEIRKPSFYGFRFLNYLEKNLIEKGESYIVTTDSRDRYNILAYNYKHLNVKYYLQEVDILHTDIRQFYDNCDMLALSITLKDIRPGKYKIKISRVCSRHGSVLDEWRKMQQDHVIRKDELEYLKHVCNPGVSMYYTQSNGDRLTLDLSLEPQEIVSIQISLDYESVTV